jgi:2-C-methyl-D-erythritol 4-phosphate cytidylyltransferase
MEYSVIILCAGKGTRTGLEYNKMFYSFQNKTIYELTLSCFLEDQRCTQIIVVCKDDEKAAFQKLCNNAKLEFITGGKERQNSVYNGLQIVKNEYVFIHDGARPFLKNKQINDLLDAVIKHQACLLMVPCKDTIKEVENGKVVKTLKREKLMQAQTPQVFLTSLIKEAYQKGINSDYQVTDDASMVEVFTDNDVYVVNGDYENIKITTKEDLTRG